MSAPTKKELLAEAQRLGITGGSSMTKTELEAWIAEHAGEGGSMDVADQVAARPESYGTGHPKRITIERNPGTGEWWCPYCHSPRGSNGGGVTRCECGATLDGDEVVAP
jgi:hypothetical protein